MQLSELCLSMLSEKLGWWVWGPGLMQSEVCAVPSPFTHLPFWREEKNSWHIQDFFEVFEPWCSPELFLPLHLTSFCSIVQKSDHRTLLVPSLKAQPPPPAPITSLFLPPKTLHLKGWKMLQPGYHQDRMPLFIYLDIKRSAKNSCRNKKAAFCS